MRFLIFLRYLLAGTSSPNLVRNKGGRLKRGRKRGDYLYRTNVVIHIVDYHHFVCLYINFAYYLPLRNALKPRFKWKKHKLYAFKNTVLEAERMIKPIQKLMLQT